MALSVFGKPLAKRPAPLRPTLAPPTSGKIINKIPTPTKPLFGSVPIAKISNRATNPAPEDPTRSAPNKFFSRAIDNVTATVRKPDRGAANVLQGAALTMPDGTTGGSPVTPAPIRAALSPVFQQIIEKGGNVNLRQTQIGTLARESYLDRVRNRDITAAIGIMKRRGMVQRQGLAYIAKPFPSTLGALEKAQIWRIKNGTPTGIVGDRAANYPSAHVGVVYAKTVAPLSTNQEHVASRTGGTALAAAPIPNATSTIAQPGMTKLEAVGKAYAWAPADSTAKSTASPEPLAQTGERWLLLIGVAVLGFFLIKKL